MLANLFPQTTRALPVLALAALIHLGGTAPVAFAAPDDDKPGQGPKHQGQHLTRYAMANQCWALVSKQRGKFLQAGAAGYVATGGAPGEAEAFYLKPTALGTYLLMDSTGRLLTISESGIGNLGTAKANDTAEWTVRAAGDGADYPPTPAYDTEPTPEQVQEWLSFRDPKVRSREFTIASTALAEQFLSVGAGDALTVMNDDGASTFGFVRTNGCAHFPEAESNFSGEPFSGTTEDGRVLGHVDAHVHISATEFLGGAEHGRPYHRFGVEHALSDCSETHGEHGMLDTVGNMFGFDLENPEFGHATSGFPEFEEWPGRHMLTHEAIYWKWIERAWAAGLRVIVNDLVDNETLCELQRNVSGSPLRDCNPMNSAGRQAGTMYGLMNYIDAQYGGPGKGFFRIVHDADAARAVIEDGKIAVILGIEISNLFNCKVNYTPGRSQRPFEETGEGGTENSYGCTRESLVEQMDRAWGWGVRQIITIHEFDNAFGGNGIFDGLILNLGNRENSGAIPSGDLQRVFNFLSAGGEPAQASALLTNSNALEQPTGEWWTTYDCPIEGETENFSGYLWSDTGGSSQSWLSAPYCQPMGQGGRYGGPTPCYPKGPIPNEGGGYRFSDYPPFDQNPGKDRQCNARWMTPIGLFAYKKIMEKGFIFDWDHLEMGMKTQLLELAEAQEITYPLVSTHGTFGGTTIDQAQRLLRGGGVLYPSNGSSRGFVKDMQETLQVHRDAGATHLFGFGYGTDTNGLSAQSGPRNAADDAYQPFKPVEYPFSMYAGAQWNALADFENIAPIRFDQPRSSDAAGNPVRTWHEDVDGNAHYGMLSDFIQEIVLEGSAEDLKHLYNSAELYLRMWRQTERSSTRIRADGGANEPEGILREAPPHGTHAR